MPYNIYNFEVIIDPLLFNIRLRDLTPNTGNRGVKNIENDAKLFDKQVSSVLNEFTADTYYSSNFFRMFGFQNLSRDESVQRALSVQKSIKSFYSSNFEVDLGFSTLGLKEHEYMHKNLLAYKDTTEFDDIMSGKIRFLGIEEYETWMEA